MMNSKSSGEYAIVNQVTQVAAQLGELAAHSIDRANAGLHAARTAIVGQSHQGMEFPSIGDASDIDDLFGDGTTMSLDSVKKQ